MPRGGGSNGRKTADGLDYLPLGRGTTATSSDQDGHGRLGRVHSDVSKISDVVTTREKPFDARSQASRASSFDGPGGAAAESLDSLLAQLNRTARGKPDQKGMTPLHWLCKHRDIDFLSLQRAVHLTKSKIALWKDRCEGGRSPLTYLVSNRKCSVALLSALDDLGDEDAVKRVWDTQTKNGYSALMKLCDGPSVTVALLEKAIEQAGQDSWGHQSGSGYTALHVLCGNVNADLSKELLDSATKSAGGGEAWAVAAKNGFRPLHVLCSNERDGRHVTNSVQRYLELLESATRHSADSWKSFDSEGQSPLHRLCGNAAQVQVSKDDQSVPTDPDTQDTSKKVGLIVAKQAMILQKACEWAGKRSALVTRTRQGQTDIKKAWEELGAARGRDAKERRAKRAIYDYKRSVCGTPLQILGRRSIDDFEVLLNAGWLTEPHRIDGEDLYPYWAPDDREMLRKIGQAEASLQIAKDEKRKQSSIRDLTNKLHELKEQRSELAALFYDPLKNAIDLRSRQCVNVLIGKLTRKEPGRSKKNKAGDRQPAMLHAVKNLLLDLKGMLKARMIEEAIYLLNTGGLHAIKGFQGNRDLRLDYLAAGMMDAKDCPIHFSTFRRSSDEDLDFELKSRVRHIQDDDGDDGEGKQGVVTHLQRKKRADPLSPAKNMKVLWDDGELSDWIDCDKLELQCPTATWATMIEAGLSSEDDSAHVKVVPTFMAIRNAAHGSGNGLLAILLNDICPDDLERAMPIFETPCVEQLIKFKWEGYAQRAFLMQFALHICQTAAYNYLSVRMGRTSTPLLLELKPPVKAAVVAICMAAGTWIPMLMQGYLRPFASSGPLSKLRRCSVFGQSSFGRALGRRGGKRGQFANVHKLSSAESVSLCISVVNDGCWIFGMMAPLSCAAFLLRVNMGPNGRFAVAMSVALLIATCWSSLVQELKEGRQEVMSDLREGKTSRWTWWVSLRRYFDSVWNLVDIGSLVVILVFLVRLMSNMERERTITISIVGTLLLWFRMIDYLGGFQATSVYVRMMLEIVKDMATFLGILLIFFLGNSFALMALYPTKVDLTTAQEKVAEKEFSSFGDALFQSFNMMILQYDQDLNDASFAPTMALVNYAYYTVMVGLVMLNLLIALMGGSYDRVSFGARPAWLRSRAHMIVNFENLMSDAELEDTRLFPRWFCFFTPEEHKVPKDRTHAKKVLKQQKTLLGKIDEQAEKIDAQDKQIEKLLELCVGRESAV